MKKLIRFLNNDYVCALNLLKVIIRKKNVIKLESEYSNPKQQDTNLNEKYFKELYIVINIICGK